ncbi:hypothetical protein TSUD_250200 [Trifolium subterraneum]|nr:hypothetical protein TSUD_250200 [Trifolium subterraneum]
METRVPLENRVAALESQMTDMKSMLKTLIDKVHETNLSIEEVNRKMGKKVIEAVSEDSTEGSSQTESRLAGKKVKLPLFDGEDPGAWITRAEIYFDVQNTSDEMRVKLSQLSIEGSTIHWFNLLMETEDELSWEKLKRALIARRRLENPFEELSTLKQQGTVEEFVESFELLSSQVGRLPEEQYLGYFMSGLKPQIRRRVRTLNPRNCMDMMRIAKDVEGELRNDDDEENKDRQKAKKAGFERLGLKDWAGSHRNRYGSQFRDFTRQSTMGGSSPNSKTGTVGSNSKSNASNSNSSALMNSTARKNDGGQRSGNWKGIRSFHNEEMEERRIKGLCFKCGGKYHPTLHKCPERSLPVLILGEGETMNEEGEIVNLEELSEDSDEEEEVECKVLGVLGSMGESHTMKVEGKIHDVDLLVLIDSGASHNFISPKVTNALGLVISSTAARNIRLGDGHKVTTQGMCKGIKMKMGDLEVVVDAWVLELGGMDMVLGVSWLSTLGKVVMDWKAMTMQFSINDQMVKLQGHEAINVRPYRYPHHQKEEIDRQVTELLSAGVIRPSMSAFSSPVIRVKKKDKSWRMCIDYRALNKATIPDKYPIPIVDELYGAAVFSKIDLKSANKAKCLFGSSQVDYLGHIISGKGVAVDPSKVQCIIDWPRPKNVKGVRGFLGLTGYYRKFVKDYGKIAKPLTELTKKDNFHWGVEAEKAFTEMKLIMTSSPVLILPNFEIPFEVECNAAGRGIGAVLMQHKQPIAFFSKALSAGNLAKSVYEKELMALVLSIQHWRHYILGREFIVYTDHKSLKYFLQQRLSSPDQQCWLAKLLGYQFEVKYKPGTENRAADALSRCFDEGEMNTIISFPIWADRQKLLDELAADAYIQQLVQEVQTNPQSRPGFHVKQGVLLYHDRLVISPTSPSIPWLLEEFHNTPSGGHSGFLRTYRRLADSLYWVGMQKSVRNYVRACDICQRQKYSATTPGGLLQPLPIPNNVWEDLSIDFITGLPKSKGFEAVLVVVDRLSKYSHFILLKHPYSAKTIAELFMREVVRLHGIPNSIISDRDPLFVSHFWLELFKLQGTKLRMSSAYHPETDGQTEVINRCLESYLRCFASDHPKNWSYWISWAEFWYNSTFHISIGKSPFEVVYGRKPPPLLRFLSNETKVAAVALELSDRDEALSQLKLHLSKAQEQMAIYANKKRRDLCFEVGEWVFLKLRPHRQHSVVRRMHQKLAARFYGPFQIIQKIGAVAYKLDLPPESKIHPVFHISLLKRLVGDYQVQGDLPKTLEIAEDNEVYPAKVLGSRTVMQGDVEVHRSLI